MRRSKLGQPVQRWFSQTPVNLGKDDTKYRLFYGWPSYASRFYGRPVPQPEYVPLEQAIQVARWLAAQTAKGTPAVLDTNVARASGYAWRLRTLGWIFRALSSAWGVNPIPRPGTDCGRGRLPRGLPLLYVGNLAGGCGLCRWRAIDDMHVLLDKLALIQRTKGFE